MRTTSHRLAAGATVGALAASGLLFTAPSAQAADRVVKSNEVNTSETRSTGHNVFLEDGVRVYTESNTSTDKAAGYFDVDIDLADAGEPSMQWTPNAGQGASNLKPSVQLVVDFDADGESDGILVGEPTYADGSPLYGNDWWISNGSKPEFKDGAPEHGGGSGSSEGNHGTLDGWRTAYPDAVIAKTGWSLGSGVKGDGTINSISVGSSDFYFTSGVETTLLYKNDVSTRDTRANGHNVFRPTGGIRVYTDDNSSLAKADGYFAVGTSLADAGEPVMDYRTTSGTTPPGLQLAIDFDGDGDEDGTLVGEPKFYGNDWWLTNGSAAFVKEGAPEHGGGSGSTEGNHGTLAGWREAFPDAQVLKSGYSLGSGVKGDFIVDAITVGLTKYAFTGKNRAPSAGADKTASTNVNKQVVVSIAPTDPDGDALTVSATAQHGTAEVNGTNNKITFTPTDDYSGAASFTYTVNDGRGGTDSATVQVTVAKYSSKTALSVPSSFKIKKSTKATVTVTSTGAAAGDTVDLYVSTSKVGTGKLGADKKVTITFKVQKPGAKRVVTAKYRGGNGADASQTTKTVKVTSK